MPWISTETVSANLVREASALVTRLGHKVPGWSERDGAIYGICQLCHTRAVLRPRWFGEARMRGVPVTMNCVPAPRGQQRGWGIW